MHAHAPRHPVRFVADPIFAAIAAKVSAFATPLGGVLVIASWWRFLQEPSVGIGLAQQWGILAAPSVLLIYVMVIQTRERAAATKALAANTAKLEAVRVALVNNESQAERRADQALDRVLSKIDDHDRGLEQAVERLVEKIEHSFELMGARIGQREPPPPSV
jgi:hypothetical protein